MTATIMNGRAIANDIQLKIAEEIQFYKLKPSLAVVLVGDDPASSIYVKKKMKVCHQLGIHSVAHKLDADSPQNTVLTLVDNLSKSITIDGILVQLPLPSHIDKNAILNAIHPNKDVDGFHPLNVGKLLQGNALLKPCTPSGILELLNFYKISTQGKRVTIINRSQVVGQPLAVMLQQAPYNATVTVCHEFTDNLYFHTLCSDIIVTAVGKYPNFHLPDIAIPDDCTVIDVAMNRIDNKLVGDVIEFEQVSKRVKFITAIPGGVGPLTIAYLMKNTLITSKLALGIIK